MSLLQNPRNIDVTVLDDIYDIIADSLDFYMLTSTENVTDEYRLKAANSLIEKFPIEYRLLMSPIVRNIFITLHDLEVGDYNNYYQIYLTLILKNERTYITHPFTLNTLEFLDYFGWSQIDGKDTSCVYASHSFHTICAEGTGVYNNTYVVDLIEDIVNKVKAEKTADSILDLVDAQFNAIEAIITSNFNEEEMISFISRILELKINVKEETISELDPIVYKLNEQELSEEQSDLVDILYCYLDGEDPGFDWKDSGTHYASTQLARDKEGPLRKPDEARLEAMTEYLNGNLMFADDLGVLDDVLDIFEENLETYYYDYRESKRCIESLNNYVDDFYANHLK